MTPSPSPSLSPGQLYHACDPAQFSFDTTADLEDLGEMVGQLRAMDAMRFGADIRHEGYNVFALGPSGLGKRSAIRQLLETKARTEPDPDDWCYVNNFAHPDKPRKLRLPSGRGSVLRAQMAQLVDYLRTAIPALFDSDEYRGKMDAIRDEFRSRQEKAFGGLGDEAQEQDIVLLRTPGGFAFAPTRNKEIIPPEEYEKLPEEQTKRVEEKIALLQERLEKILHRLPQWHKERAERIKQLNRDTVVSAVENAMIEPRTNFSDLADVLDYLDKVQQDLIEHADDFSKQEESAVVDGMVISTGQSFQRRYRVNVLVGNGKHCGAPIISEDNPTFANLVGRVEHMAQLGALVTDFSLIKPGALHRANGGYLLLDVRKVLMQPFAWEGLKRVLKAHEIHIESLGQMYSLVSTVSLEPEPIPLKAKIVLFGDRLFYYLLQEYDPEFCELFKVAADFEEQVERTPDNDFLYARLFSTLARQEGLLPFDRGAVARTIEHCARMVGDAQRLSTHIGNVKNLLREADYWAHKESSPVVQASHVQQSIDQQIRRQDRLRNRLQEEILRGTLLIATEGETKGQINGLAVLELGGFAFAHPMRITATTRLGEEELINIEREAKLSGKVHSKGVLILSAFLAARYAKDQPMALSASLVFEQSYGMVEGDSASLAELCVLITHLADAPVKQSLAVTGSVNQLGQVQPIGAVNEKIEGFFDICAARGLNGEQGVLIPDSNVQHLMLRRDVVEAAEAGRFHIHAVEHVDEALAILTGLPAGALGPEGYPEGSINDRVAKRLAELTRLREKFSTSGDADSRKDNGSPDAAESTVK